MEWLYYWKYVNQITLNRKSSQKLSFTNVLGHFSNFGDCESFHVLNSLDVLALWETNWDDSIDSSNFSLKCYLPFVLKDSVTHVHCLVVYQYERLSLSLTCPLKTEDSFYKVLIDLTLFSILLLFLHVDRS